VFCWWDPAEFVEEPPVVEPVDPFQSGEFEVITERSAPSGRRCTSASGGTDFKEAVPRSDGVSRYRAAVPPLRLITIERVALLQSVEFFVGVPTHVLAAVARLAEEIEKDAGENLIVESEEGDCLYVIARGRVRVEKEGRPIAELGVGEVVGELAVLSPGPRSASVIASEPSLFLRVGADVVAELLLDHPQVTRGIIEVLVRRVRPVVYDRA
jgi:CRP/FNR family transcriptional regulator, cyclic AMP receptor protein